MSNRMYPFLLAGLLAGGTAFAQSAVAPQRNCGTMEVLERQLQENPQLAERLAAIERHTSQYRHTAPNQRTSAVVTIPVVVHVVYNTSAQNVSDAMVQAQINVLNEDFRKLNADVSKTPSVFAPLAADCQIQFCLAQRDPSGNPTSGITRTQTTKTSFSSNDAIKYTSLGGKDAWPADQYLNLWVGNLSNSLLGYAQFPGGAAATDGVVILYSSLPGGTSTSYNKGRTATHEVGHWLNLRHIWGDATCGNDLVSDTPTQQTSNGGCPAFPHVTCSNGPSGDMFMNYMDYTYDACMYMFTQGQATRMNAVLAPGGFRYSLLASQGCSTSDPNVCNAPGGLAATGITTTAATLSWSAAANAVSYNVQYRPVGSATWTGASASGTSLALSGLAAGTAYEFQVQSVCANGSSGFSGSGTFSTASVSSGTSVIVGAGTATVATHPYGTYYMDERVQYIITNAELRAAGYSSGSGISALAFYVTSASSQAMNNFTIKIAPTTATAFSNSNYQSTAGATTVFSGSYTATANAWNNHAFSTPFTYDGSSNLLIDICFNNSAYTTNSSVRYTATASYRALYKQQDVSSGGLCSTSKGTRTYSRPNMRFTFSGGAAIAVGDVPESEPVAEIRLAQAGQELLVYPNPVSNQMTVAFRLPADEAQVQLELVNLMGQQLASYPLGAQAAGEHLYTLSLDKTPALATLPNGIYLCTIRHAGQPQTVRFLLQR